MKESKTKLESDLGTLNTENQGLKATIAGEKPTEEGIVQNKIAELNAELNRIKDQNKNLNESKTRLEEDRDNLSAENLNLKNKATLAGEKPTEEGIVQSKIAALEGELNKIRDQNKELK